MNKEKTVWLADEIQYLGHRITAAGIQLSEEKVRAVLDAREPTNLQELRTYLGLVQYLLQPVRVSLVYCRCAHV